MSKKTPCPLCGKEYVRVKTHLTKSHPTHQKVVDVNPSEVKLQPVESVDNKPSLWDRIRGIFGWKAEQ